VAVMALERVPSDIRAQGGVARMADLRVIEEIFATAERDSAAAPAVRT